MEKTLLIADDAPVIRRIIRDVAQADGWQVLAEAANGKEAVEGFFAHRPHAMTLDLVMPDYDGLYALREIHARDRQARIVVVSALNQKQVLTEAFQLGAVDFVIKPFNGQYLAATLQQLA